MRSEGNSSHRLALMWLGVVAASAALVVEGAGRALLSRPSALERLAELITVVMPPQLFSLILDRLLYSAKPLMLFGLIIGVFAVSAGLGALLHSLGVNRRSTGYLLTLGLIAVAIFAIDLLLLRPASDLAGILFSAGLALAFAGVFALGARPSTTTAPAGGTQGVDRRLVLTGLAGITASLAVAAYYWSSILAKSAPITARSAQASAPASASEPTPSNVDAAGDGDDWSRISNLSKEVTPTDKFYFVSKNFIDPHVSAAGWKLTIAGLVENPLSFTYDELKQLPSEEQFNSLMCISNEIGGDLIGNAHWRGVRLKALLERAKPGPGVKKVVLHAADGYADSITFDAAMREANLLAYEMNGAPLNDTHGFPLRLLVPGIFGMKNVKWITKIELMSENFLGYWQLRGWSDPAPVKTMSRIDTPLNRETIATGKQTVAGIAFSGDRGIKAVEVSADLGKSWRQAEVKSPLGPYTWVLWRASIELPPGDSGVNIWVRAIDGAGNVQPAERADPYPDGASGYHVITLSTRK